MKKWLIRLAALFICTAMATGCHGSDAASDGSSRDDGTVPAASSAEPGDTSSDADGTSASVHEPLTLLTGRSDYRAFISALHEVYPEINIELKSYAGGNTSGYMRQTLEIGDIPDIYSTNYFYLEEEQQEYLLDLSKYDFVNEYTETMLNEVDVNGSIYLLPSSYSVYGIYYNKTMFEEHGWEVPATFEELNALTKRIEEETDIIPVENEMSLPGHSPYYFFSMNAAKFFGTPAGAKWKKDFLAGSTTAKGNIEEAIAYFRKWVDAGYIKEYDVDVNPRTDFNEGKTAILLTLAMPGKYYAAEDGTEYEFSVMPWLGEEGDTPMLISSVSRYYGINRKLAEPGNEQKLEDALNVMRFMSTAEGQLSLTGGLANSSGTVLSIKQGEITEDNILYDVKDMLTAGYTVPLVYAGWVDHLIYPMYYSLTEVIRGEMTDEEFITNLDEVNAQIQADPGVDAFAVCDENLSIETAAKLCAVSIGTQLDADAALTSYGGVIYDNYQENKSGASAGIYKGDMTDESINAFRAWGTTITYTELTGAEIKQMLEDGRTYTYTLEDGTEKTCSFPYVMVTKGGMELDDSVTYKVAFNYNDYAAELKDSWGDKWVNVKDYSSGDAIKNWLAALDDGHLTAEKIVWN